MASANNRRVVSLLNEMLERDRAAMSCLFFNRVPANDELIEHPLVNFWKNSEINTVGILGVLNGILQECELQQISMVIDERYPETIRFFECCDAGMPLATGQKNSNANEFESPIVEE